LRDLPADSEDASVTDPPYLINVLGEDWDEEGTPKDAQLFHESWAVETYRVLKPGAYLVAFGAPRTYHRMVCGIEDAGFEIRDTICWIHPQNIPKSVDAAKAIDRLYFEQWLVEVGADFTPADARDLISDFIQGRRGTRVLEALQAKFGLPPWGLPEAHTNGTVTAAHPHAQAHAGRGTALKPVWEPILVARKPLRGTVAENVLQYGTGALNIDDARIPTSDEYVINRFTDGAKPFGGAKGEAYESVEPVGGRYPSNVLVSPGGTLDPERVVVEGRPVLAKPKARAEEKCDTRKAGKGVRFKRKAENVEDLVEGDGMLGAYTRFFVIPKPSSREKDEGLSQPNSHVTVKPVSLMRHLVRMVVPKGGSCIDPFMGSGTTGVACVDEERDFTGFEKTRRHFDEAQARVQHRIDNHDRSMESVLALLDDEE
jgi:site-specific DNA-methyltransferase (adenine-specific)